MGIGGAGSVRDVVILRWDGVSVLASGAIKVNDVSGGGGGSGAVGFSTFVDLSSLNTALSNVGSEDPSQIHDEIDSSTSRRFTLAGTVNKTGTPTDVLLEVRFATNADAGTTAFQYQNGFWGDLRWDDTAIAAGFDFAFHGDVESNGMQVFATMTGNNTVTLSNMTLFLKD